jgi:hypothetical protein
MKSAVMRVPNMKAIAKFGVILAAIDILADRCKVVWINLRVSGCRNRWAMRS